MNYLKNLGDERQSSFCVYCGRGTETREHVPSRVLLDEPYPKELPTIGVCGPCNQSHSLDEEYVACLIECARLGTAELGRIQREKIRRILSKKLKLLEKIKKSIISDSVDKSFVIETSRFNALLTKLARGHLLYEQNTPHLDDPLSLEFGTLHELTEDTIDIFDEPVEVSKVPEVGSRMMQRLLVSDKTVYLPWIVVQPGRYRYVTPQDGVVLMVLSEYVWCRVVWE